MIKTYIKYRNYFYQNSLVYICSIVVFFSPSELIYLQTLMGITCLVSAEVCAEAPDLEGVATRSLNGVSDTARTGKRY